MWPHAIHVAVKRQQENAAADKGDPGMVAGDNCSPISAALDTATSSGAVPRISG